MAKTGADLQNKLTPATTQGAQGTGAIVTSKFQTVNAWLTGMKSQLAMALPKHITADRVVRLALTTIRRNPKLLSCSQESLLGAVMQSAQLGLEPGIGNQAHIVPYSNAGKMEAQFQIGYEGYIDLMYRNPRVLSIIGHVVYEKDKFSYGYGSKEYVDHVPYEGDDRGKPTHAYVRVEMHGGTVLFHVMSKAQIDAHAKKYSKSFNYGNSAWQTSWEGMALKTCVRQIQRWVPKSVEIREAIDRDFSVKRDIEHDTYEHVDENDITLDTAVDVSTMEDVPNEQQQQDSDLFAPAQSV